MADFQQAIEVAGKAQEETALAFQHDPARKITMGGGTDVALETADAAGLHGRVADIAAMIELSQRTMANIRQNLTLALGLKAVFLVTTVIGLTGLWPAILADTGATVLVTGNALRLLRFKPRTAADT